MSQDRARYRLPRHPLDRAPKQTEPRPSKYHNTPIVVDGIRFASQAEAAHYGTLQARERAGELHSIAVHPSWDLHVLGVRLGRYSADFSYYDCRVDAWVYEDVKGGEATKTQLWRWKVKHLLAEYGIRIVAVQG